MNNQSLKQALDKRRSDLGMTYKNLQARTELGYNTVRRVFEDPKQCRVESLVRVARAMGCELIFTVRDKIGDELAPEVPVEPIDEQESEEASESFTS